MVVYDELDFFTPRFVHLVAERIAVQEQFA
jgi:hypothetical protein